jgi:hypothetical protein
MPVEEASTLGVAAVVLIAAGSKLLRWKSFQQAIAGYRILPRALIYPAGVLIVAAEFGFLGGVVLSETRRAALLGLGGLMVLFVLAQASAMIRGLRVACGCIELPGRGREIGPISIARSCILAIGSFFGAIRTPAQLSLESVMLGLMVTVILVLVTEGLGALHSVARHVRETSLAE